MEATLNFSFRICAARSTFAQRYSTCWMPSPNLARYFAMAPSPPGSRVVRMSRERPSAKRSRSRAGKTHRKAGAPHLRDMPKPVLLTVDDDPEVLRAIERDLRSRYADRYRVMRANSGSAGLATLRELKARNNPVALLLADQRMPQMDGVNFLSEAMEMHPLAKRALLTAYADTNAAIDAINEARVHYYLMKPWDPPEEKLFPALDDLLHDWTASFRPPYEGIRVLGTRWSNRSYELREFLARNQVPYQWIDVELAQSDPEVRGLIDSLGPEADKLPLILFPD